MSITGPTAENILIVLVVALVPTIPAYILYKSLPSTADVSGPLQGMQVKLGGAFAGYFMLVVLLLAFFNKQLDTADRERVRQETQVWKVVGRVDFQGNALAPDRRSVTVTLRPPEIMVNEDGSFNVTVVRTGAQGHGGFPLLVIEHPEYQTTNVSLDDRKYPFEDYWEKDFDDRAHEVVVKKTILLKPKAINQAYTGNGVSLTPLHPAP